MKINAYRDRSYTINITDGRGGSISSDSVTDNLLFLLLEKLEDVRCGLIDVENEVQNRQSLTTEQRQ